MKPVLRYGLQKAKPAVEFGLKAGKSILQKVDQIYKKQLIKRFIKKDWQKELEIPQGWNKIDVKKQDGVKYRAPKNPTHNEIRVMKARPDSQWPSQHVDYVKIMRDGHYRDINGNVVLSNSAEAHIPLSQLKGDIKELIKRFW